ncbi:MAG TPA: ATP-binding protein [Myxococcota bacterium]|nr:ATP-binding protein [Myxococcota bacterium]
MLRNSHTSSGSAGLRAQHRALVWRSQSHPRPLFRAGYAISIGDFVAVSRIWWKLKKRILPVDTTNHQGVACQGDGRNAPGHGSGLGLVVAREIVADHEGEIEVASEPREGTEFRIRFPALAPDPQVRGTQGRRAARKRR